MRPEIEPASDAMRIRYDTQVFRLQSRGGISRYFVELIKEFASSNQQVFAPFPTRWTLNQHAIESGVVKEYPRALAPQRFKKKPRPVLRSAEIAFEASQRLQRIKPGTEDIYHPTYYVRQKSEKFSKPMVVTLVDMIPEVFPQLFSKDPHSDKHWYLRNADAIIAISESAADDIHRYLPEVSAPVHVVPLAVDSARFSPVGDLVDCFPRPWVLFVGNRGAYKDFNVLLAAILSTDLRDVHVVAAGRPFSGAERRQISDLGLSDRVHHIVAADAMLPTLYRSCDAFVFPSRYEGFGLPTLEALSSGAPVLLANSSSHPEAGGTVCKYFEPTSAESLASTLSSMLRDDSIKSMSRNLGPAHAAKFTWTRTSEMTADVYRSVVEARTS